MTDQKPESAQAQVKLAQSAGKIEKSARAQTKSAQEQTESADRRTELAADRTVLAAERTYAAWIRTGLAALASGVGARALLGGVVPDWLASATASLLILFSAFCYLAAVWRQMIKVAPPRPATPRLPASMLIVVNGFLTLVSLAALVGIWIA